jgi:hypothetical protein
MRRGSLFLLGGIVAVACALPDVSIVSSFGDDAGSGGRAGAGAGRGGGAGSAGSSGTGGNGGKGAGGASQGGTGAGTGGSDGGEAGEGATAGGTGGQTGGSAGKGGAAGNGGAAGAGRGGAGASSGGASAGTTTSGAGGGGAGSGGSGSPTCGDGTPDPGEACDDGNTSSCGTCAADCLTATPPAPARGTLQITIGAVMDGERFTLDDGFGAVDFEFDDNMMWDNGVPRVGFSPVNSANDLRDAIIGAVNNPNNGLAITAEAGTQEGQVVLTNDNDWGGGNRAITDQVSNAGFTHTGMSGGAGYDCLGGTGCTSGDDCDENFVCTMGVCSAP